MRPRTGGRQQEFIPSRPEARSLQARRQEGPSQGWPSPGGRWRPWQPPPKRVTPFVPLPPRGLRPLCVRVCPRSACRTPGGRRHAHLLPRDHSLFKDPASQEGLLLGGHEFGVGTNLVQALSFILGNWAEKMSPNRHMFSVGSTKQIPSNKGLRTLHPQGTAHRSCVSVCVCPLFGVQRCFRPWCCSQCRRCHRGWQGRRPRPRSGTRSCTAPLACPTAAASSGAAR